MGIWRFPWVLAPYGTRRSAAKNGCTGLVFVSRIFVAPYDSIRTMIDFGREVDAAKDKSIDDAGPTVKVRGESDSWHQSALWWHRAIEREYVRNTLYCLSLFIARRSVLSAIQRIFPRRAMLVP